MNKNKRIGWLSLSLVTALIFLGALFSLPNHVFGSPSSFPNLIQSDPKIDDALIEAIESAQPSQEIRYIAYFASETSLDLDSLPLKDDARRPIIVSRLKETAASSQATLLKQLDVLKLEGHISNYSSLWIINAIAINGSPASVEIAAKHPGVQRIELDQAHRYFDHPALKNFSAVDNALQSPTVSPAWGVQRIQADKVWRELGIRGQGATVAVVDTGVDLFHPDLVDNYRGNLGNGTFSHEKNWYHTSVSTSTMPFDFHGHGTHVTGSAVGANGIGVAPGAKWIAVAITDESGLIHDSSVHKAFQWLLAPGGDPAAAPDVVNNSWGGAGDRTEFQQDVEILHAAGIITVFAAGNAGPAPGTILSPASFPGTLAAGASDDLNRPAWFSGRGPSPLTNENKPLLVAPGTQILSAMPGGAYARQSGTSMSAPHVAGTIALMLSADPAMNRSQVIQTLTETATPLASNHPNSNSGWGLLDAFSAVLSRQNHGVISGRVSDGEKGLDKIQVSIWDDDGLQLTKMSDESGRFSFLFPPGSYRLSTQAFGFADLETAAFQVEAGARIHHELTLQKQPGSLLQGIVSDNQGPMVDVTITIPGTPIALKTDAEGKYQTNLPQGDYTLIIQKAGYRLINETIRVNASQEYTLNVRMDTGPSILLVDSGQWQYVSASNYYRHALRDTGYSSDSWVIADPNNSLPTLQDLLPYDIVIWSAPNDSPVRLAVNDTLIQYLNQGGNLLISGQNLASLDGRAGFEESWFLRKLEGVFVDELNLSGAESNIMGVEGSQFFDLNVTLNGQNSAKNQESPDLVEPRPNSFSEPIIINKEGMAMGLQSGFCEPYRIVYLGFGLEGVNQTSARAELLKRSLDTLLAPRNPSGVGWIAERDRELVIPGQQLALDIELQNFSELITDTFDITLAGNGWTGDLITQTLTLEPCQVGQTSLIMNIPEDALMDEVHEVELTAVSQSNPQSSSKLNLELKTPGQILLVDDDRFFDGAPPYRSALETLNLNFDVWDTEGKDLKPNILQSDLLNAYEIVIWFTGYDWHAPVTQEENFALTTYLRQGGRLFLSSQDYLFYNLHSSLTRELGIVDYQETITPTVVYAEPTLALPADLAGPLPLSYSPYQNFSDGLIPSAESVPFFWHNQGMAAGVGRSEGTPGRSLFWGFPFETLPANQHAAAMNGVMGWLTDWGDSTLEIDRQRGALGETRTYTLTLQNGDLSRSNAVAITNTLPAGLQLQIETLAGDAGYNANKQQITWQGTLEPGESHQIIYQVQADNAVQPGAKLVNRVEIYDPQQGFSFEKSIPTWFNVPDLSQSQIKSQAAPGPLSGIITYSLSLQNDTPIEARNITATLRLPDSLHPLTETLATNLGNIDLLDHNIIWNGSIAKRQDVTATLVLTRSTFLDFWLPATTVIEDGLTDPLIRHDLQYLPPYQSFFPVFPVE